jgi:tetratricopeptide (TPR) repeat protein
MTSTKLEAEADMMCCASCGIAGVDDVKLEYCNACKLVRYCSVECQQEHSPQHEQACKKRAAELHDEILFKQPESSHFGDCPICFLPLPIDPTKSTLMSCCSKSVCNGCNYANQLREFEQSLDPTCPFCRHRAPKTKAEVDKNTMKRAKANDPLAMSRLAASRFDKGDYGSALDYWTKAAELGDAAAHYQLSCLYHKGAGVEKDMKKAVYHWEEAAIGGHPIARYNLGCHEKNIGQIERAGKHFIIAANLGHDTSLKRLMECYNEGHVQKDDFAAALRAHQAAVSATRSPQREAAAEYMRSIKKM